MGSLFDVGISAEDLADQLDDGIWVAWTRTEPVLATFSSLQDPAWRTSIDRDAGVGALLRLAANDDLAAVAVCHRLQPAMVRLAGEYWGVRSEIESAVVGSLWEAIREFPVATRDRAYAAHLVGEVRLRTRRYLTTSRHSHDRFQIVRVGNAELLDVLGAASVAGEDDEYELVEFLTWAQRTGVLSDEDLQLLRELILAGHATADGDTPWNARGVASEAAREWLAARTGSSARTIRRRTDRVVHNLQAVAARYLNEVA